MHFATLVNLKNGEDIYDIMEPYSQNTEDERYLEFEDCTEAARDEYNNEYTAAIKLPNGTYEYEYGEIGKKYIVRDNIIYQRDYGRLKNEKRSKAAKKLKYIQQCPWKKVYKTFEEYANYFYRYNKEENAYGYYTNFDAQWDWYQVGGRWPFYFLVKKDCKDSFAPDPSWCIKETKKAPKGYMWVSGAKICDIEWKLMMKIKAKELYREYYKYKKWYEKGNMPNDEKYECYKIDKKKKAILAYGSIEFEKNESLNTFFERSHLFTNLLHCVSSYSFLNADGEWITKSNDKDDNWDKFICEQIESCDKNSYLVLVDCHM